MRSKFSRHADRYSLVYVLFESLSDATNNCDFSTFISQSFYVGSTDAADFRRLQHSSTYAVGFYLKICYDLHYAL